MLDVAIDVHADSCRVRCERLAELSTALSASSVRYASHFP